ncbi:hypothetical protein PFDG_03556 [Plasmodium falciparum Dd2]|uniref:RAP domain-containing protein n=1 Tax=Plasmodium falciparum (isolate Dd2) TaxID=57267 RepID=A0A0L7M7F9_PLAF4|nr:hypothetical protein PFDG_03556 [Plasmodium falciparum Dd2]
MLRIVWKKNIFLQHHFKRKSSFVASQLDVKKLSTKHLGSFSFDILRLCEQNKELYESYKCRVMKDIDLLDGKDCYRILKSLEINNKINEEEELLKYILKRMCIESCRYSIKEICDICFVCSKLNIIYIPLFASLSIVFINKINLASPEHLTIMCLCYSKIQIKDINLFNRISVAALNILYMYDVENLINLLLSYIYLDIPVDLLLHSCIPIFIKNEKKLDANSLTKLAYVYSNYKYKSHDINCLLKNKLPLYISSLNNIQLSELIISLDRLHIKHDPICKYYTNVNLICLDFSLAIKVIHVLSQLKDICLELKYDEIFLCINNFVTIHGKYIKSGEIENYKYDEMLRLLYMSYGFSEQPKKGVMLNNVFGDNVHMDVNYDLNGDAPINVGNHLLINKSNDNNILPINNKNNNFSYLEANTDNVLEEHSSFSSLKIKELDNNEYGVSPSCDNIKNINSLKRYYFSYNTKTKLDKSSLCYLYTDIFESIYNIFMNSNNNIYEYDEKLKIYMNDISKEIVKYKKYCLELEKSLEHYSATLRKKGLEEEYMNEECIIYNYIEYNFKQINLWSKRKHKGKDKNGTINNNNDNLFDHGEKVMWENCSSYNWENTINMNNKLLTLELYNIVQKFNKNIKINHKEEIYFIPIVEYENYIAFVFLQPEDYYYSSSEKNYLCIIEQKMGYLNINSLKNGINCKNKKDTICDEQDILQADITHKPSLILINDVLYNPYKTFYNDTFFIKSNVLFFLEENYVDKLYEEYLKKAGDNPQHNSVKNVLKNILNRYDVIDQKIFLNKFSEEINAYLNLYQNISI